MHSAAGRHAPPPATLPGYHPQAPSRAVGLRALGRVRARRALRSSTHRHRPRRRSARPLHCHRSHRTAPARCGPATGRRSEAAQSARGYARIGRYARLPSIRSGSRRAPGHIYGGGQLGTYMGAGTWARMYVHPGHIKHRRIGHEGAGSRTWSVASIQQLGVPAEAWLGLAPAASSHSCQR